MLEMSMRTWFADRDAMGEVRGEVKTLRRFLAKYLHKGLGDVPEQFRVLIANSVNAAMLESLIEQVVDAKDLRALLPGMEKALRGGEGR